MRHSLERSLHVLSAALIVEHPEMSVDALRSLRGASMSELTKAAMMVLRFPALSRKAIPSRGKRPRKWHRLEMDCRTHLHSLKKAAVRSSLHDASASV